MSRRAAFFLGAVIVFATALNIATLRRSVELDALREEIEQRNVKDLRLAQCLHWYRECNYHPPSECGRLLEVCLAGNGGGS